MHGSSRGKAQTILLIGLAALVIGTGLTLMPFYHDSNYAHLLAGLSLGVSLPALIVGLMRIREEGAA